MKLIAEPTAAGQRMRRARGDELRDLLDQWSSELVVGSRTRIHYSGAIGRIRIAQAFNRPLAQAGVRGFIVPCRNDQNLGAADSRWRATANIKDSIMRCAEVAVRKVLRRAQSAPRRDDGEPGGRS